MILCHIFACLRPEKTISLRLFRIIRAAWQLLLLQFRTWQVIHVDYLSTMPMLLIFGKTCTYPSLFLFYFMKLFTSYLWEMRVSYCMLRVIELEFSRLNISNRYRSKSSRKANSAKRNWQFNLLEIFGSQKCWCLQISKLYREPTKFAHFWSSTNLVWESTSVKSRLVRLWHLLLPRFWIINRLIIIPYWSWVFHFHKFAN